MTQTEDDFNLTPIAHREPVVGEYLVIFTCLAELHNSQLKQDIVNLLQQSQDEIDDVITMLTKFAGCTKHEALKLTLVLCKELASCADKQEVLDKPHEFIARVFYYGKPEDVPISDKRWSIHPLNFDNPSVCVIDKSDNDGDKNDR